MQLIRDSFMGSPLQVFICTSVRGRARSQRQRRDMTHDKNAPIESAVIETPAAVERSLKNPPVLVATVGCLAAAEVGVMQSTIQQHIGNNSMAAPRSFAGKNQSVSSACLIVGLNGPTVAKDRGVPAESRLKKQVKRLEIR